jgi:hypothetical protein
MQDFSGTVGSSSANVCFVRAPYQVINGYQIQNTNASGILYIDDSGATPTTSSQSIAAGATYTSPDFAGPAITQLQVIGSTSGLTYAGKAY